MTDTERQRFAARLRLAATEARLSQRALARRLGVVQRTIVNWHSGEHMMRVCELLDYARLCNRPVGWFLEDDCGERWAQLDRRLAFIERWAEVVDSEKELDGEEEEGNAL